MESLLTLVGGEGQTLHLTCTAVLRHNFELEEYVPFWLQLLVGCDGQTLLFHVFR